MPNKNINKVVKLPAVKNGYYYDPALPGPSSTTVVSSTVYSLTHVTSGVNNGRKSRPMSAYSLQKTETDTPLGSYYRKNKVYRFIVEGRENFLLTPNAPGLNSRLPTAINNALAKFKSGGANISVAVAEGQKTIDMIADKLGRVRRFAHWAQNGAKYYRGMKGRKRKAPPGDQLQSRWLELQYGWLPLMSDLDGLLSALAGNIAHHDVRAVGKAEDNNSGYDRQQPWPYERQLGVGMKWERSTKSAVILVGELDSKLQATAAAMGLTNPLEVAWEKIPYSFVADWFLPIGKTLSALDATRGYTFKKGCYSTKTTYDCVGTVNSVSDYQNGVDLEIRSGNFTVKDVRFNRGVYTSFPGAQLPQMASNPFSTGHCLNALALLVQTFRSIR